MDVKIRPARPSDAAALTDIAMRSKQSNGYDDTFMAACADELRVTPDDLAAHLYWVAETTVLCGFVALQITADTGKVASFFIAPDWQRRGIGRLLWATVRTAAIQHELTALTLDADPEAKSFYAALGFTTIGRVPSGSIPGRSLPQMTLTLSTKPKAPQC